MPFFFFLSLDIHGHFSGIAGPGARGVRAQVSVPLVDVAALRAVQGVAAQPLPDITVPVSDPPREIHRQLSAGSADAIAGKDGGEDEKHAEHCCCCVVPGFV